MKKLLFLFLFLALLPGLSSARGLRTKYADRVDPFIGTDFHGHTFPGAAYPFGMVQLSPDTREDNWDGCSGYHYSDDVIKGFSHTHLSGTGCADLCDIRVMPVVRWYDGKVSEEKYESPFSHRDEEAVPGYYAVHLDRWDVDAELTVGRRMGAHRYTYPRDAEPQLIIDLKPRDAVRGSSIERVGNYVVQGWRRSHSWADDQYVYFYMKFSRPIIDDQIVNTEKGASAVLTFGPGRGLSSGRELVIQVGISSVSVENARLNLESESGWFRNGVFSFDLLREATKIAWDNFLSKIEVEGDETAMRVFYTALYHTALAPALYSDVNGEYRGMDGKIHTAEGFDRYHIFSLWDTYRTLHPLFNIIERERTVDFIKSMLSIYDEQGKLPRWELSGNETDCMIGYSAAPMIADAMAKGITGFDRKKALKALVETSNKPEYGIDVFRDNGLVLAEREHESVSKTLEYAVDDWCIAQVARMMGETRTEQEYLKRSTFWRNIYDPVTGFMRPRVNGIWLDPFDPTEVNVHYTEANSWQYSFHVQHDVNGLISASGGDASMEDWLDELFSSSSETVGWKSADMTGMVGQYAQGNEPSHHIAYLYSYAGLPWKTQRIVRRIMEDLFTDKPDGLCGNEDCGQMSAWYVMSALGFYPVTPGSGCYVFGSPLFRKAEIHLENGKTFTVRAPRNSRDNIYVNHVMRDGAPYAESWFRHADIEAGRTFVLGMDSEPNVEFGAAVEDRPYQAVEVPFVGNPWFTVPSPVFSAFTKVGIEALDKDWQIWYRILPEDGKGNAAFERYEKPFTVSHNCMVEAYCTDQDGNSSFTSRTVLRKAENNYKVTIAHPYSRLYSGGGDNAIVDGVLGSENFRLGGWQGYQDCDMEAVIDMGRERHIRGLSARFLQDTRSWIILPRWVEFLTSRDGENWISQGRLDHEVDPQDYTCQIHEFSIPLGVDARYVKVVARNFGTLPEWHAGAGGEAHIFVDEVTIK